MALGREAPLALTLLPSGVGYPFILEQSRERSRYLTTPQTPTITNKTTPLPVTGSLSPVGRNVFKEAVGDDCSPDPMVDRVPCPGDDMVVVCSDHNDVDRWKSNPFYDRVAEGEPSWDNLLGIGGGVSFGGTGRHCKIPTVDKADEGKCHCTDPDGAHTNLIAHTNGYESGICFHGHTLPSHDPIFHTKRGEKNATVARADNVE